VSNEETSSIAALAATGGFHDGDWVESKDQDPNGDIRLVQLADIGDGAFRSRSSRWINDDAFSRLNCSWIRPGDVLIARMPDPIGRACIAPNDLGRAITVVDVAVLRCNPLKVDNRYAMYAINESSTRRGFELAQDGATRQRIPRKVLGRSRIPLPNLDEQRAIAEFLDQQTSRIDTLIGKQTQLIATLRERRAAIADHVVWSGLGSTADTAPSGVDCAPLAPTHWVRSRAKAFLYERDATSVDGSEELLTVSHLTGITPRSQKNVNMIEAESHEGYRLVKVGDLVINTMWAWMGALGVSAYSGMVSPAYGVYAFRDR
jgi:type I restriction enzyme S subunit